MPELLADARQHSAAVGAFTVYNLEAATGVLRAAERRSRGVILLISSQAFASPIGPALVTAMRALAERTRVPCCLQLDHESDLGRIEAALNAGCTAVMADGSHLRFEENVAFVRAAVELAARYGAAVEAELGHVAGEEEIAAAAARGALTEPDKASEYVRRTSAACLAVSIGNIHGRYSKPPRLDWARLEAVREAVSVALALHGASGIPDRDIRRAVRAGIAKINVNTELRDRVFDVLSERTGALRDGARLLVLTEQLAEAVERVVAAKLALFEVGP
jgi:ketose-bisphosphate aldolase